MAISTRELVAPLRLFECQEGAAAMPAIVHGGPSQHFLLTLLANGDVWKGPRRRRPEQQFPHCRELDGAKSGILLVAHVCETAADVHSMGEEESGHTDVNVFLFGIIHPA